MNKIIIWIGVIVVILILAFVFFQSGSQPTTEQQEDTLSIEDTGETGDQEDYKELSTDDEVFDVIDDALDFLE